MYKKIYFDEITIIGPGLIGASIALSAKKKKIVKNVIGIDNSVTNLKTAIKIKAIDKAFTKIDNNINKSSIIFICTPVSTIPNFIKKASKFINSKAIITDVGSVKNLFSKQFYNSINQIENFVPGHPVAGTEFSGAKNASNELFEGKWCLLTPEFSNKKKVNVIKNFWSCLEMNVSLMTPQDHDKIMSMTSHLPHLIAFTIVEMVAKYNKKNNKDLMKFSAGGFRDFTRIASSDPIMWKDIFIKNKSNMTEIIDLFIEDLLKFRSLIQSENSIKISSLIKKSKHVRRRIVSLKQN
tara:strand:+ start:1745 stop:2629 length:885 start_codon:yes stop_codon:yes gene_type:complete